MNLRLFGSRLPLRWRKLRRLSLAQRDLLWGAATRVALARVALWVLPLPQVRALVGQVKGRRQPGLAPEHFAWAVRAASRCMPGATCLVQAVALQASLARSGWRSQLMIGVALGQDKEFRSHAWVECAGRIVIGETPFAFYKPLLVIESHPQQKAPVGAKDSLDALLPDAPPPAGA